MLGKGRPDTMGYADEDLYQRRDAHLSRQISLSRNAGEGFQSGTGNDSRGAYCWPP
jgi:hypothetical protein